MTAFGHVVDRITRGLVLLGGACVALMMLHVAAEIVLRAVLNRPLPGTITIVANYYMIVAAFAPLALLEQRNDHISVDIVSAAMPDMMRRVVEIGVRALTVAVLSLLAARTWAEALSKTDIGAAVTQGSSSIPVWPAYYVLPVGAGAMALVAAIRLIEAATPLDLGLPGKSDPIAQEHPE
ncbi:TRAP transporter small permease [Roseivivax marinus]|uniref:TRAP transporter small permease n=1 Tax=Roseivivax marinus TaxID=1379903 RepID=UPI001F03EF2F|nr:TRAP transporter small permease [Roseivivax marinus]UMA66216.1 TRAP transporter small permease [Roseivivax marinus]